ncbi:DUF1735 and LamG domain-containing protein [Bacteroides finegoldii]|jgi:hypothetical protein|uniref:DUF1735 and LamG domain-containing protein n=1 Tax=Bacteroides finegoldii TaxID=338188 RepID=UPI00189C82C9|nr:DUF1735 and LamG domain-containing protein [Bacteroides finegoldii]
MKIKYLFGILCFWVVALTSCQEAASLKDVILFTGTESSPKITFTIEEPRDMGITVTATNKVEKDTKVFLDLGDKSLLESYNAQTGKKYELPPAGSYKLSAKEAVIKAGNYVSENIKMSILSLDKFVEGVNYCVPVVITGTDGDMSVLEASRVMYVVINRTIISKAVDLHGRCGFNVPKFMTDSRLAALDQVTMEIRVRVNSFPSEWANPGISSLMGIEENFLFRFGDISIEKNQLQLAPAIIGGKKYFTTGETRYTAGKWHQVVCVYDGSSTAIYVDGKLDVRFSAGPGTINLNDDPMGFGGFWFGKSCGGRYLNGAISEARFWTKALTMNEIQDNACYVDPKTDGLLAYWRFNAVQDDGVTVHDETGNGFDAIAENKVFTWIENVKCPF